jgi:hypothetical protein
MADNALFIGWGLPVQGREQKALGVFGESVQYWSGLQQSGQIESFEVALLDPHGGDLNGFALLRGTREQLDQLRASADLQRLVTRAQLTVGNMGVVGAVLGGALSEQMNLYQTQVGEIA